MANLKTIEKSTLEKLFQMRNGYVLDFTDRMLRDFFTDELNLNIYSDLYNHSSGSKANRIRGLWKVANNEIVGTSIIKLIEYIEHKVALGELAASNFPDALRLEAKKIASRLITLPKNNNQHVNVSSEVINEKITIVLNKEVFAHVQSLLASEHYYNAVEESYKIVRSKLKQISGKEKAHEAFASSNWVLLFGRNPIDDAESDFFEGVKFLHMAIQNLRNDKSHTPAKKIDKNLAIHFIVLASLAYDLIDRQ